VRGRPRLSRPNPPPDAVALLPDSAAATADPERTCPALAGGGLLGNASLWASLLGFSVAQVAKVFTGFARDRRWVPMRAFQSGGMPSSHSSFVTAALGAVALRSGLGSDAFSIALVVAIIVMYDACHVRYEAGQHATVLNSVTAHLFSPLAGGGGAGWGDGPGAAGLVPHGGGRAGGDGADVEMGPRGLLHRPGRSDGAADLSDREPAEVSVSEDPAPAPPAPGSKAAEVTVLPSPAPPPLAPPRTALTRPPRPPPRAQGHRQLKEVIGHTKLEVAAGGLLGLAIGLAAGSVG